MNDELIEKLHCIYKNLFNLKKLDGKLLDGDVLLFNYKYLELFVEKYVDILNRNRNVSNNDMGWILTNIYNEIDRLIANTRDKYYDIGAGKQIYVFLEYYENISFFKDLYRNEIKKLSSLNENRSQNSIKLDTDSNKTLNIAKEILDSRQEKGIKTYGTTLDESNLSDKELLNHAIEEVADLFLYLTKLKHK